MSRSKLFSIAGVSLTLFGLLILSTILGVNRWLSISGVLILYLGLRLNWRYSMLLQKAANGYFILLFGSIFLIVVHISWFGLSFVKEIPEQSSLYLSSGNVVSHKLVNPGSKSETYLRVELDSKTKNFRISAYNVGRPMLDQISSKLNKGTKVKAWLSCQPQWKCRAYRLHINSEQIFGLDTIARYHQSTWIRMSRGLLIVCLVGIALMLLELLLRKFGINKASEKTTA